MAEAKAWPPQMTSQNEYYDLGNYQRAITTSDPEAQVWFNRGLIWSYAFNHEESAKCFEKALLIDPDCAMAYWGLAYSLGPNYNKPWASFETDELNDSVRRTHEAVEKAGTVSTNVAPVEKALVEGLKYRYPQGRALEDCSIWNEDYADAMGRVYREFAEDLDVATLYADALMNLTPWALWDIRTGKPSPDARTMEAKSVLEQAFTLPGGQNHPGLLHLYIHLMEMSASPESALNIADRLRGLVPDAGHLQHMPTHLDILCGDYRRAISSNTDAYLVDEKYLKYAGPLNFYTLYRAHDYHFLIYAAMFAGQLKPALDTVTRLEASLPEGLLRIKSPPMADWLESFLTVRVHVLIRFGRWDDILALPLPTDQVLYCVTIAMLHYAKGIAWAALKDLASADKEHNLFRAAAERVAPSRTLFNNKSSDLINIASAMLDGELAYRHGEIDTAFDKLQSAITLDDTLPYDEPWGWMQPTRHAYGALLLEQGRVEEAAAVYRADLGFDDTLPRPLRHPNNVWALHGYHECLLKLNKTAEAKLMKQQLDFAIAVADVPIKASCFCRLSVAAGS